MQFHPIANIFPLLEGDEFEALKNDIARNGLMEEIWLHSDGSIIDGRNRWRACNELGIEPRFRTWDSNGSLIDFVVSLNLHRRHLSSSQKACVAAEIEPMLAEEARERMAIAGTSAAPGRPAEKGREFFPYLSENGTGKAVDQAAVITGTNGRYVQDAKKVKQQSPQVFNLVKSNVLTIPDAKRVIKAGEDNLPIILEMVNDGSATNIKDAIRKKNLKEQIEAIEKIETISDGKYSVIAIDPPWSYNKRPTDITHRAANPYPPMTIDQLKELDLPSEENCILWLWVTNAFMVEAHELACHWGFEVKTILTWVKDRMGLGDWLRGQTEHCLMCIKGKPIINLTNQTTVIHGPLREHSRKPDSFYEMVNDLCPGTKIEYFARENREGWDSFGNETTKF